MVKTPMFPPQGGAGSIPGQGTKISRAIWHDREKKFKKRSVSCRSSGWADVSVLSLWAWLWLMTRAELWGAGVSGEVVHALWVPTLPGSPPNQVLVSGGRRRRGSLSSSPQSPGSAPGQPVESPSGFAESVCWPDVLCWALPCAPGAECSREHQGGCRAFRAGSLSGLLCSEVTEASQSGL